MKIEQLRWTADYGWDKLPQVPTANLVLLFAAKSCCAYSENIQAIGTWYPDAVIIGCSTAGEIFDIEVTDDTISLTAIEFEKTEVVPQFVSIGEKNSFDVGRELGQQFPKENLRHIFVLSDGQFVNGTDLVAGLSSEIPSTVSVTGGLAGDGVSFGETFVITNGLVTSKMVAAVGLYGDDVLVSYGSAGGWSPFGPERIITRSSGNILYELDDKSALDLYKRYLGEYAESLPASALLFPLQLMTTDRQEKVIRTILNVNEQDQSMIFAGDMPKGGVTRFMRANIDGLVGGAEHAASIAFHDSGTSEKLAILVSCIGRKLVLKQRVEEEVEAVQMMLGAQNTVITGFYSYGEIAPTRKHTSCDLHNQTMTITVISER